MNFLEKSKQNLEEYKRILENKTFIADIGEWVDADKLNDTIEKYSSDKQLYNKLKNQNFDDYTYNDEDALSFADDDRISDSDSEDKKELKSKMSAAAKRKKKELEDIAKPVKTICNKKGEVSNAATLKEIGELLAEDDIIALDLPDSLGQTLISAIYKGMGEDDIFTHHICCKDMLKDNLNATGGNIALLIKTSKEGTTLGNDNFTGATLWRFEGYEKTLNERIRELVPNSSYKKLSDKVKDSSAAGSSDATAIQEIIQGALIEMILHGITTAPDNSLMPYISKGSLLFLNPNVFENLMLDDNKKLLDLGIDESYKIGFDKFFTNSLNFGLTDGNYIVVHPNLKPCGIYSYEGNKPQIQKNTNGKISNEDLAYLFGKTVSDKDDFAPADVYIIDPDKIKEKEIITTLETAYKTDDNKKKTRDECGKELVRFTNTYWFKDTIKAVSLKKAKDPELHTIINSKIKDGKWTDADLPNFKIGDIKEINVNKTGNSSIIFQTSALNDYFSKFKKGNDDVKGFFEFRSKDSGKTWQCNINIANSSDAIMGGSAKNHIKNTFSFASKSEMYWDQTIGTTDLSQGENGKVPIDEVIKFIKENAKEGMTDYTRGDFIYPLIEAEIKTDKDYILDEKVQEKCKTESSQGKSSPSSMRGRVGLYRFIYALIKADKKGDSSINEVLQKSFKLSPAVQNTYKIY